MDKDQISLVTYYRYYICMTAAALGAHIHNTIAVEIRSLRLSALGVFLSYLFSKT